MALHAFASGGGSFGGGAPPALAFALAQAEVPMATTATNAMQISRRRMIVGRARGTPARARALRAKISREPRARLAVALGKIPSSKGDFPTALRVQSAHVAKTAAPDSSLIPQRDAGPDCVAPPWWDDPPER